MNWAIGSAGGPTTAWVPESNAIFPAGTSTVTIDGAVAPASVTFAGAGVTLEGGTLDFGAAGGTINVEGSSAAVTATITGSSWAKAGPGLLNVASVNNSSGTRKLPKARCKWAIRPGPRRYDMCYAGTLDLNDCNIVVSSLSGYGGTVTDNNATPGTSVLTVDQSISTEFDGVLADGADRTSRWT